MRLLPTTAVSTLPVSRPANDLPQSELILNGERTGIVVDGAVLEAAVSWRDSMLLFLTDDIPFEETLRIYLFDASLAVVDSARLSAMYTPGIFTSLQLVPPDTIHFHFFGDFQWALRLLEKRTFALPVIFDPPAVHRPVRFFRWFEMAVQR
jgi:hypothetical protein